MPAAPPPGLTPEEELLPAPGLTPEEESLPDPDAEPDEIDETLPADLWF